MYSETKHANVKHLKLTIPITVDPRAGLDVVVRKKDTTQKARSWCLE
jgi:hypothetical protein